MEPELSQRLAMVVDLVPLEDRRAFVKRVSKATKWSDITKEDQKLIITLEEQL